MMDLTPIVRALITLMAAAVTAFLVPWLKARMTREQRETLMAAVSIAVDAAEQLYRGEGRGAEKKEYARTLLRKEGYDVDAEAVNAAVEAAVLALKTGMAGD